MITIAAIALTVSVWLTGPTFGGDPTMIGMVARTALVWLIGAEVARQAIQV